MTDETKRLAAAFDEANNAHRVASNNETICAVYRRAWRQCMAMMREVGCFHPEHPDTFPPRLKVLEDFDEGVSRDATRTH